MVETMAEHSLTSSRLLITLCVAALSILQTACGENPTVPDRFTYREQTRNETLLLDPKAATISDGHIVQGFASCNDEFICVRSPRLFVVIPRSIDGRQQWSMDGRDFRVVGKETITLDGRPIETYKVESAFEGIRAWFNFSPEAGLVAFGASSNQGAANYKLDGTCGYGAKVCPKA